MVDWARARRETIRQLAALHRKLAAAQAVLADAQATLTRTETAFDAANDQVTRTETALEVARTERAQARDERYAARQAHQRASTAVERLQRRADQMSERLNRSTFAGFGDQAAAAAQAEVTARISSVVGWAGTAAENRAAMRVRRSLISMSSKAGSVLSPYHGWSSRRASMSAWS